MPDTVGIIWQRFGPYHLARLAGAWCRLDSKGVNTIGIEIASSDHYAWESACAKGVEKRTLFPNAGYESLSRRNISRAVDRILDELNPKAVAVNGWAVSEALAATAWCRRHDRPVILMSETHIGSGKWWKEWIKRLRVRRCDSALVGGGWHADYLASLGFPRDHIFVGYDAVDNEYFERGAEAARRADVKLRKELALPQEFLFANTRFLPRKNIDGLLRAYAHYRSNFDSHAIGATLSQSCRAFSLVISGSGEMEASWKALASTLGISNTVHWPGFVQYTVLPKYYGLASAFIHPARVEPWGLVVNEAAAAGLPLLVGNRVGAACELVEDGGNGFLIDPDDIDQMAAVMTRLSRMDVRQRAAMGQRSRELVAQFAPNRFGDALWSALVAALPALDSK